MLKIDLSIANENAKNEIIDVEPIQAFEELVEAREELNKLDYTMDLLQKSILIAEKDFEDVKVASESLTDAYVVLGYTDVSIANESLDSIMVAKENMLQNAWEKTKEITLKIWEWIRNLVMKVIDYVKSLLGKEGATYQELEKLLDKLDKEGRTILNKDEFPEPTRKRLADKVSALLVIKDKKLTGDVYVEYLKSLSEAFKGLNSKKDVIGKFVKNLETIANSLYKDEVDIAALVKLYTEDLISGNSGSKIPNVIKNEVESMSDAEVLEYLNVAIFPDKVKVVVLEKEKWFDEAIKVSKMLNNFILADDKNDVRIKEIAENIVKVTDFDMPSDSDDTVKLLKLLVKIFREGCKIRTYEIKFKDNDYDADNVVPVSYTDAKNIVSIMKDNAKQAEKLIGDYDKAISKAEKEMKKILESFKIDRKENKDTIHNHADSLINVANSFVTNIVKEEAKLYSEAATTIVRNNIGDVIKESARLYEKP